MLNDNITIQNHLRCLLGLGIDAEIATDKAIKGIPTLSDLWEYSDRYARYGTFSGYRRKSLMYGYVDLYGYIEIQRSPIRWVELSYTPSVFSWGGEMGDFDDYDYLVPEYRPLPLHSLVSNEPKIQGFFHQRVKAEKWRGEGDNEGKQLSKKLADIFNSDQELKVAPGFPNCVAMPPAIGCWKICAGEGMTKERWRKYERIANLLLTTEL